MMKFVHSYVLVFASPACCAFALGGFVRLRLLECIQLGLEGDKAGCTDRFRVEALRQECRRTDSGCLRVLHRVILFGLFEVLAVIKLPGAFKRTKGSAASIAAKRCSIPCYSRQFVRIA